MERQIVSELRLEKLVILSVNKIGFPFRIGQIDTLQWFALTFDSQILDHTDQWREMRRPRLCLHISQTPKGEMYRGLGLLFRKETLP